MTRDPQKPRTSDRGARAPKPKSTTSVPFSGREPSPPTTDESPRLDERILDLVWAEPFASAIASLGSVTVFFVMRAAIDPLQAFDEFAANMRGAMIEAMRADAAARVVH